MELGPLLQNTDVRFSGTAFVQGISYDSRTVKRGEVFVALPGSHTDGVRYAAQAEKNGAAFCIAEKPVGGLHIPVLHTENARRTLAFLCANACGIPQKKMKLVGITGTNGKTSTAYMLWTVLRHAGFRAALIGTQGAFLGDVPYTPTLSGRAKDNFTTMTTPDPDVLYPMLADFARQGAEYVVMEVSSHALALSKVAPIEFDIGIFTNLSAEHMDFHKTMENYLAEKAKLFRQCRVGLFNADSPYTDRITRDASCTVKRYGVQTACEYKASDVQLRGISGCSYLLHAPNAHFRIKMWIPGSFTVYNSLAAASAAREIGIDLMTLQNALYALRGIGGRLERIPLGFYGEDFSVFIDYAHTPFALENLLTAAAGFRSPGQRIVTVIGCGGDRDREKRPVMGRIAAEMSDFVYFTSDNPRTEDPDAILRDILAGVRTDNYTVIPDRKRAIETAIEQAEHGDILLLVGKGHEQYEADKDGLHPFSEREIAEKAAERKGNRKGGAL